MIHEQMKLSCLSQVMIEVGLCQRPSAASCFTTTSMFIRNLIPNREVSTQCSTNIDQRQKIETIRLILLEPWKSHVGFFLVSSLISEKYPCHLSQVSVEECFRVWELTAILDKWFVKGEHSENRKELIYLCISFESSCCVRETLILSNVGFRFKIKQIFLWKY